MIRAEKRSPSCRGKEDGNDYDRLAQSWPPSGKGGPLGIIVQPGESFVPLRARAQSDGPILRKSILTASDGYGQRLAERLRAEQSHAIITRGLRVAGMAVTETRCDKPVLALSNSIHREDAYLVALTLRDFPNRQYWEDGRQMPVCSLRIGQVDFHDLKRDPVALLDKPYHDLFFYLPRSALDEIAEDANAPRVGDLNHEHVAFDDDTIASLGRAVLPALSRPDQASQLFVNHVLFALAIHVAQTYGGMRRLPPPIRGGLATWQVKRAKEILTANLDGRVLLKEVASECQLSVSHFSRAFSRTTGTAPHKWLLSHRIEVAKEKLRDGRLSLLDVALACGFADQSHLTRVFTRIVGVSPGAWRRALSE
jgi:AraC family transcriptional regulator